MNDKRIKVLNELLAEELTAINQYMVHAEMCAHWGYTVLHDAIQKQAIDEMHHAEWLIERILFLDGAPTVSKLNAISIGKSPDEILRNDADAEGTAISSYNDAIRVCREAGDNGSVDLLTKILKMEEGHVEWAKVQRTLINQMGLETYLGNQAK
jgi:bacterioferritin